MADYIKSRDVIRVMTQTLTPMFEAAGYRRPPKTRACWARPVDEGTVKVCIVTSRWSRAELGGGSFNPEVHLAGTDGFVVRWAQLSRCRTQAALDELREVQAAVNARRPQTDWSRMCQRSPTPLGALHLERYTSPDASRYRDGAYVEFDYYSDADIHAFAGVLERHAVAALNRFLRNECATPIVDDGRWDGMFTTIEIV